MCHVYSIFFSTCCFYSLIFSRKALRLDRASSSKFGIVLFIDFTRISDDLARLEFFFRLISTYYKETITLLTRPLLLETTSKLTAPSAAHRARAGLGEVERRVGVMRDSIGVNKCMRYLFYYDGGVI
jgi:hypothetical protein